MIVLGQSLNPDGSVPVTVRSRVYRASEKYRECPNLRIIVSGGDPANTGCSEAKVMFELLILEGVPAEAIILEEKSMNTLQNAYYCLMIMNEINAERNVYIVSSEFHLPRAQYLFDAYFNFAAGDKKHSFIPCPAKVIEPDQSDIGINSYSRVDRLRIEKDMMLNYVEQKFLRKHIPGLVIPPLPRDRFEMAICEIDSMLSNEQN